MLLYHRVNEELVLWIAKKCYKHERYHETLDSVGRGIPKGGALQLLLWILVMNGILRALKSAGVRAETYADDLVVLIPRLCTSTISSVSEKPLL